MTAVATDSLLLKNTVAKLRRWFGYPGANDMQKLRGGSGMPASGTSGTGAGDWAYPATTWQDTDNGVLYINEGTLASPYWTPVSHNQRGLMGGWTDFRDAVGKAVADTAAGVVLAGSGLRIFGQGIAETDSGVTIAASESGPVASLITTDEDAHTIALSWFGSTLVWQPDVNGRMVIEAVVAMSSAITARAMFIGFLGTAADALDPAVTGATTTLTLVQDDLAGLYYDSQLTDADRLYAPHNKSNEAASIETTDTGVDTGVDFPAAGTYTRLRVEISAAGVMTCFKDKVQVTSISAALDADEEVIPVLYMESASAATKTMLCKQFGAWTNRV